ncbi:hypothetical protein [Nocardia salmonicida]|uniref:hypothetical protein n=1 Tax=Nocardia salmonicida TaxID=53431 RepID=UPI002E2C4C8E|nr:hypothetical protein [Nocardia salmonicida]
MASVSFQLDRKGVRQVLNSPEVTAWVASVAKQIGDHAQSSTGARARVSTYRTDRAAASVSVPARLQASQGALTRAAAAAGLPVRPR